MAKWDELAEEPDEEQDSATNSDVWTWCHGECLPLFQLNHLLGSLHCADSNELATLVSLSRDRHGLDFHVQNRDDALNVYADSTSSATRHGIV